MIFRHLASRSEFLRFPLRINVSVVHENIMPTVRLLLKTGIAERTQNDYFPGGKFVLANTDAALNQIERALKRATEKKIPVILVKHIAPPTSPFFAQGTPGGELHPRLLSACPDAIVVHKTHADSFYQTNLEETLCKLSANELLICGMMTHNCVTHTAISKSAEKYAVTVLMNCSATVSDILQKIALNALSIRVKLANWEEVL